jgi:hypothetical protein
MIVLVDAFKIISRRVRLPNRSRSEIHDLVPVSADVCVQFSHSEVRPVSTHQSENVAQGVGLGDCSVNVRHDNVIC